MPKRTDGNQADIVLALRLVGASVFPAHEVGRGFPDLVVAYRGRTVLLEVKDGAKPPSARKLTPPEEKFHAEWQAPIPIVTNSTEALEAIGFETFTED